MNSEERSLTAGVLQVVATAYIECQEELWHQYLIKAIEELNVPIIAESIQ